MAIKSPLISFIDGKERDVNKMDLAIAASICSDNKEDFNLKKLNFIRRLKNRFYKFEKEYFKFAQYLKDYVSTPSVWVESEDGESAARELGAPWILAKVVLLLTKTHLTEERIWTMPFGEMLWYCATVAEMEGVVKIGSDEESKKIEQFLKGEING